MPHLRTVGYYRQVGKNESTRVKQFIYRHDAHKRLHFQVCLTDSQQTVTSNLFTESVPVPTYNVSNNVLVLCITCCGIIRFRADANINK